MAAESHVSDLPVLAFEGRQYTRADLDALVSGMATALEHRGVRAGARVALMSSNRPEFVVAVRAIWALGAAVVLVSTAWKRAEIEHALALTRPTHAVGDGALLAESMPMLHLDEPVTPGCREFVPVDPDADAVFVFSSGTTGMPKAVRHTHGAFAVAIAHWRAALGLSSSDRMQIMTPPSHILGLLNIATAMDAGAWVRLHPRFNVEEMLRHVESDRITVEMAVAPIALALAAHPDLESYDLSSLRYVMWCATPVTESVAAEVTRRTGVTWATAYGASELPVISCNSLDGEHLDTVGRAVPGVETRVVSLETALPVGPGEVGEIQVQVGGGDGRLPPRGCHRIGVRRRVVPHRRHRSTSTPTAGSESPTEPREMIKVRGFQVAPAEIEAVLHGHPAVADCAVFGLPDQANGEAVVAAVTRSGPVEADELIQLVADQLAYYKRPSRVVFVAEIPRLTFRKGIAPSAQGATVDVRLTSEQRQLREAAAEARRRPRAGIGRRSRRRRPHRAPREDRSTRPAGGRCARTRRPVSRSPSSSRNSPAASSTCPSSVTCWPTTSPVASVARCRCPTWNRISRFDEKPCGSSRIAPRADRALP